MSSNLKTDTKIGGRWDCLQGWDWSPSDTAVAYRNATKMTEPEQEVVARMLSEPGVPRPIAIEILKNFNGHTKARRQEILADYASGEPHRVSRAKTSAADRPPMIDERIRLISDACRPLRKAIAYNQADLASVEIMQAAIAELKKLQKIIKNNDAAEAKKTGWPRGELSPADVARDNLL